MSSSDPITSPSGPRNQDEADPSPLLTRKAGGARLAQVILLRLAGAMTLLALPTAFLPETWMNTVHQWLGLGELPQGPIVTYMARSLSMLYATLGAMTWILSTDVDRYRPMIAVWAFCHLALGSLLVLTDVWAGFSWAWALSEGIPVAAAGVVILALQRAAPAFDG